MNRSSSNRILQITILIFLTIICFIYGSEVMDRFDGGLFSYSAVPIRYSLIFLFLLIGIGITLGFLIEETSVFSKIIFWWPLIHFVIVFIGFIVGLAWNPLLFVPLFFITLIPMNLIGEGISLGFQTNRLLFRRGQNELLVILFGLLINLIIIIYVLNKISKDYLANLIF